MANVEWKAVAKRFAILEAIKGQIGKRVGLAMKVAAPLPFDSQEKAPRCETTSAN